MKRFGLVAVSMALLVAACEDGSDVGPEGKDAGADGPVGIADARDVADQGVVDVPVETSRDVSLDHPLDSAVDTSGDGPAVDSGLDTPADQLDGSDLPDETVAPPDMPPDGGISSDADPITAAGGTLRFGDVTLIVPAGSLTAERTLTMAKSTPTDNTPNRGDILGDVYDFGPDGTMFTVPIALSLPLVGVVPTGKAAVIAWLDREAAQWVPVPSSVEAANVIGLVTHFTSFAVILVSEAEVCPYGGACGGDLQGTWQYTAACIKPMAPEEISCGTSNTMIQLHQSFSAGGTLTVAGSNYVANRMIRITGTVFYTPACLTAANQPQSVYADCAAVEAGLRDERGPAWNCSGTLSQGCSCIMSSMIPNMEQGTVAVTGTQATFTRNGGQAGQPSGFCVRGNSVSIKDTNGSVYSARKMP